jgi:hypothetical protein
MSSVPTIPARFPDPPDSRAPAKIVSRWELFLGAIATGEAVDQAMLSCLIKRKEIQAMTNIPGERKRYRDAKLAGLRQEYSEFDLEEFFDRVASGNTVGEAFMEVFGKEIPKTFYRLLRDDPDLEERYQNALKTKAMLEMEKSLEIVDDRSRDTLPGPKGGEIPNMAAVQRDRLRFDSRHKLASTWFRRVFGEEKKQVDVNVNIDLAARIQEGRIRAKERRAVVTPQERKDAIDASFAPVPSKEPDTKWMEDPEVSTVWREES